MDKISGYSIGFGITFAVAGVVCFISALLGYDFSTSHKAIVQLIWMLGQITGSDYVAAILVGAVGVAMTLFGLGLREIRRG